MEETKVIEKLIESPDESIATEKPAIVYTHKIRLKHKKSGISYVYCTADDIAKTVDRFDRDDNIIDIMVFKHNGETPSHATPHQERDSKKADEDSAFTKSTLKQPVPIVHSYFSKPYSIDQFDPRDKVQIANFALQVMCDPAEGALFGNPWDMDFEQVAVYLEYIFAQYTLVQDVFKRARSKQIGHDVQKIREEHEGEKVARITRREKKAREGKTHSEQERNAKKLANQVAVTPEHKKLLRLVTIMSLPIKNYSVLPFEELKIAVMACKADLMKSDS